MIRVARIGVLASVLSVALAVPAVKERFNALSIEPVGGSPNDLRMLLREEIDTWAQLFKNNMPAGK